MAQSLAQNAIAFLIDLAERGEIDPWNVKVIEVIDRFLSQLRPGQQAVGEAPYEADLSESGQAFLYASMLVLLKADSLARSDQPEEDLEPELDDALGLPRLPSNLEKRIRRRAVAQPPQHRPITLQELIRQLEVMSTAISEHVPRRRARRPKPHAKSKAVRAIAQLAHQENLSEVAAALDQALREYWPQISQGSQWMAFEQLLDWWVDSDICAQVNADQLHRTDQSDRVGVFWALLFLSAQSKVELSQQTFYQDLNVRALSPEDLVNDASAYVALD
ncbi:MAG: segregation/condensation protein A [Cyanobacteria bacterium P01_A01_bin.135]